MMMQAVARHDSVLSTSVMTRVWTRLRGTLHRMAHVRGVK